MATRTIRLDDEAERALQEVQEATGLLVSEVLKRGLRALRDQVRQEASRTPYEVYRGLDLGPGGFSISPPAGLWRAAREAIPKKASG